MNSNEKEALSFEKNIKLSTQLLPTQQLDEEVELFLTNIQQAT